jgi:peptidoglycan hydrolase-like protein with peptidoglycan-binding domain
LRTLRRERNPSKKTKKGKYMNRRKTFLTAIVLGGTVGLAPAQVWSQGAPGERRQPSPERSQPGANENIPGTRSGAAQELSKNDMKLIQQRLQEKGYNPGNTDGTANDTTRAAIRKFQQDQGIPVTGTVDERTANELGFQYSKNPSGGGTGSDQPAPSRPPSQR